MSILASKTFRLSELLLFMLAVPVALWLLLPASAILPVVWGMALFCHWLGRKSPVAYAAYGWNWAAVNRANLVPMLARFAFCTLLLGVGTWLLKPEMLWGFVREKPQLWAIVMVFYPLVSVVPQEIIFRRYLFARHADILSPALVLILVSGIGFGFAHIVFNNWVAPATKGLWRASQLPEGAFTAYGGAFYAVPRHSAPENKALAWDFIRLMTLDRARQFAAFKSQDAFPAMVDCYEDPFFDEPLPFLGGQPARLLWREAAKRIVAMPVHKQSTFADEVITTELDHVLDRGKPIPKALADAERLIARRAFR
jgi:hypothetical protein